MTKEETKSVFKVPSVPMWKQKLYKKRLRYCACDQQHLHGYQKCKSLRLRLYNKPSCGKYIGVFHILSFNLSYFIIITGTGGTHSIYISCE